jgi:hypothetical protein
MGLAGGEQSPVVRRTVAAEDLLFDRRHGDTLRAASAGTLHAGRPLVIQPKAVSFAVIFWIWASAGLRCFWSGIEEAGIALLMARREPTCTRLRLP